MYTLSHDIANALLVNSLVLGAVLAIVAVALWRADRFRFTAAGFWVWAASLLYFVVNPALSVATDQTLFYGSRLAYTEGADRVYWIMLTIAVGLSAFFFIYLNVAPTRLPLRKFELRLSPLSITVLSAVILLALYTTVKYRTDIGGDREGVETIAGKTVGDVNGWQASIHRFALVPIVFFILFKRTRPYAVGLLLVYTGIRMFDKSDRFTVVTPFLAISIIYLAHSKRRFPSLRIMAPFALVLALMVARGHKSFNEFIEHPIDETTLDPVVELFTGSNTDMLSKFYLDSAIYDEYGHTYGVTLLESALFGYLPREYFPWKDSLFDAYVFKPTDAPLVKLMFGPKSSVLGCLYGYGGIVGVLIGMLGLGYLSAKLDALLRDDQPASIRALGFTWMSFLWLMVASSLEWSLQYLVVTAMPIAFALAAQRLFGEEGLLIRSAPGRSGAATVSRGRISPDAWKAAFAQHRAPRPAGVIAPTEPVV